MEASLAKLCLIIIYLLSCLGVFLYLLVLGLAEGSSPMGSYYVPENGSIQHNIISSDNINLILFVVTLVICIISSIYFFSASLTKSISIAFIPALVFTSGVVFKIPYNRLIRSSLQPHPFEQIKLAIAERDLSKVKQLIESKRISASMTWEEVSLENGRGTQYHEANLLSLSKTPEITEYLIKQGTPVSDYDLLNIDLNEEIEVEKRVLELLKDEKKRLDIIELNNHFTEYESFQKVPNLTQLKVLVEKGVHFKTIKNPITKFLFSKFNSLSRPELIEGAELIASNGGSVNRALEIMSAELTDKYNMKIPILNKLYKKNFQLVNKLLELGANPNENIYLHDFGPEESRLLLQFGADVNQRSKNGETALSTILEELRYIPGHLK